MKGFDNSVKEAMEVQATAKRKAADEIPFDEDVLPTRNPQNLPKKRLLQTPPRRQNRARRKTVEEELYTPRISEESTSPLNSKSFRSYRSYWRYVNFSSLGERAYSPRHNRTNPLHKHT